VHTVLSLRLESGRVLSRHI